MSYCENILNCEHNRNPI